MSEFKNDAHWGKGGRYVVVDGQRVPAMPEIQPDAGMQEYPGYGVPMTPVEGDTLVATAAAPIKPKKGK